MYRRWLVPVAGLALLTASLAVAGPTAATAGSRAHEVPDVVARGAFRPGGLFHSAPGTRPFTVGGHTIAYSTNWSGYAVTGGTFTTASASWVQSPITCSGGDGQTDMSPWIGIDGYRTSTVEQTGSSGDCNNGTPDYYAWYEMYPRGTIMIHHTVMPGDHFTATVTHAGGTSYTLTLADITEGWTNMVTKSIKAQDSSAEAVMEMAARHLTQFSPDKFTAFTVDGKPIGSYTDSPYKIERMEIRVKGTVCDSTSSLGAGANFKVTWRAAC